MRYRLISVLALCLAASAQANVIDISGNNTSSDYKSYSTAFSLPAGQTTDVKMARYCYFSSTITGSGTLNLYAGGERCYLGTEKGASWPNWTGYTGDIHVYPFKENSPSAGFYGVVLAHGGKSFSPDNIEGGIRDGKVNPSMVNNSVTLHNGATICCEANTNGAGFRIGELQTEEGSTLQGYMKKSRAAYYLLGAMNTDATLAGVIKPSDYDDATLIGIIKEGTGTYRITGNQNYLTGSLRVLAGRVQIANDRAEAEQKKLRGATGALKNGNPVVYVFGKGLLGGTGSIGGTVDNYGTIEPGDYMRNGDEVSVSTGTLTLRNYVSTTTKASLYAHPASKLRFKIASATDYDRIDIGGEVKYDNSTEDLEVSDKMPYIQLSLVGELNDMKVGDELTLLTAQQKTSKAGDWNFVLRQPGRYTWELDEREADGVYSVVLRLVSLEDHPADPTDDTDPDQPGVQGGAFYDDGISDTDDFNTLRTYAELNGKFIGTAISTWKNDITNDGLAETQEAGAQFNLLVAENEMKFDALEPSRGQFSFGGADNLVQFAERYQMDVRGHCLVWHSQVPTWVSSDGKKNDKNWSRAEALEIMENHINQVMKHFKGKVREWDVVNECVDDSQPNIRTNPDSYSLRQQSVWWQAIGEDFIDSAFVYAHRADPDAKLFLNDYGVEMQGDAKTSAFYNLAVRLKNSGIPIDGVGLQCHFNTGIDSVKLERTVRRFAEAGLQCIITELDMGTSSTSEEDLYEQARSYRVVTDIVLNNDNCPTMVIWGLKDNDSWRSSNPLLYDENLQKKPAWYAVRSALRHRVPADQRPIVSPQFYLDENLIPSEEEGIKGLIGKLFVIYSPTDKKAFFGSDLQNLGYDDLSRALLKSNATVCFGLQKLRNNYLLRAYTPAGQPYTVYGKPGYLNTQPADGTCSFILGLGTSNGEDFTNGAVWDIQYVEGQGFSLRNIGTKKYLHDASPAKYDDPAYFNFYTVTNEEKTAVLPLSSDLRCRPTSAVYNLQGVQVGTTADWQQLPRGLYLVNRKKVVK